MEMFLSVMVTTALGVAVAAVLFKAATHGVSRPTGLRDESLMHLPPRFFSDDRAR